MSFPYNTCSESHQEILGKDGVWRAVSCVPESKIRRKYHRQKQEKFQVSRRVVDPFYQDQALLDTDVGSYSTQGRGEYLTEQKIKHAPRVTIAFLLIGCSACEKVKTWISELQSSGQPIIQVVMDPKQDFRHQAMVEYDVFRFPTFLKFQSGIFIDKHVGVWRNKNDLEQWIQ